MMKPYWKAGAACVLALGFLAAILGIIRWAAPAHTKAVAHATSVYPALHASGFPGITGGAPLHSVKSAQAPGQPHPFQIAAKSTYRMADAEKYSFLKNAQRLSYRDDPPDATGRFRRVSLYQTNMKYPFVRVEEMR